MYMVSIIEPVSSSKYLGSNLKDYCFSSSFQIAQAREKKHSNVPFVTITRQQQLQNTATSSQSALSPVMSLLVVFGPWTKSCAKREEVIRVYQSDVWLVKSITISWVEQV
jgi:hypothetical protein